MCASVSGCAKRLRRSEKEFVGDHAHLHQQETWYSDLTPENSSALVNATVGDEKAREKIIDGLAQGSRPGSFTLTAVSQQTRTVAGYVFADIADETLNIGQLKVDRAHQERGLGGLLLKAAEKRARNLGASISKSETHGPRDQQRSSTVLRKVGGSRFPLHICQVFHRAVVKPVEASATMKKSGG